MNNILQANLKTLQKSQYILSGLTNDQFSDTSVAPYYSSIGSHIRHVLDFYDCIFRGTNEGVVDLIARRRNKVVEYDCQSAIQYLNESIEKLKSVTFNMSDALIVIDDLGLGKTMIPYTYGSLFAQANSHTIHHYAIINYILERLGIVSSDVTFGYNPSTPKPLIE
ncbi:DinB family protein [Tamlana fucoidanivorans]|uniref:DinB family protein n=1 Tax=Allotamlana fucoidanivorans TaxID=2583814 RepID=A0A5C4SHK6_9FLAO|nr:DinB family protein [Tamlana fucoidanivorans]TNJ43135.1 DinB family protein [Tamlana fucoidanivorans]